MSFLELNIIQRCFNIQDNEEPTMQLGIQENT